MPTICEFFGIYILMFYDDHAPPHFHARYGEYEVLIRISPVGVLEGSFPPRVLGFVMEWAEMYQKELMNDWDLAARKKQLQKIPPL